MAFSVRARHGAKLNREDGNRWLFNALRSPALSGGHKCKILCKNTVSIQAQCQHICHRSVSMKIFPTEFDGQSIRRVYDEDTETWWFSVVDVVQVLTQQADD